MCDFDGAVESGVGDDICRRLVKLSRAATDHLVSVAGPSALELMSWLCRGDFERVQCARQATCGAADDSSDVLIVIGAIDAALPVQLARTVGLLRDGGVLAVQLAQLDDDIALRRWLESHGFDVASTVFDLSNEILVAHTLFRRPALRAAA